AVRNANRGTAIGQTIAKLVDRLRLVETGETQVILWTIHGDMLVAELVERFHELFEVRFATDIAHVFRREVRVHARAIPVEGLIERPQDRFAAPLDVDAVTFCE